MATYAQETNPFVNGLNSDTNIKNAPGMAKINKDIRQVEQVDLLQEENPKEELKTNEVSALEVLRDIDLNNVVTATNEESNQTEFSTPHEFTTTSKGPRTNGFTSIDLSKTTPCKFENDRHSYHIPRLNQGSSKSSVTRVLFPSDEDTRDCMEDDECDDSKIDSNNNININNDKQNHHLELIKKLRLQLVDLERYAYERGELEEVPPSILAERQTVILNTLKKKLSLNFDTEEIEKVDIVDLKRQVDKEIHELIDPLIIKDQILTQLTGQLSDLEKYINSLQAPHEMPSASKCQCHSTSVGEDNENLPDAILDKNDIIADSLPKTSKLIKSLVTQLLCSDKKLRERLNQISEKVDMKDEGRKSSSESDIVRKDIVKESDSSIQIQDSPVWNTYIDKITLATDSLNNLFTLDPSKERLSIRHDPDEKVIESIVRRQVIPAIKDILAYGIENPDNNRSAVFSFFDPYYILSTLTCFPGTDPKAGVIEKIGDTIHVWDIIADYFKKRDDSKFIQSPARTLTQSFNLSNTSDPPIRITSKQALLITIETVIEKVSRSRPNGPEAHFRTFIYYGLNQGKLSTWLKLIFKSRLVQKYYYTTSFVCQAEKMDIFFKTLDRLSQFTFKLDTDLESVEQFESAF